VGGDVCVPVFGNVCNRYALCVFIGVCRKWLKEGEVSKGTHKFVGWGIT
jgi:hypothetical protein